MQYFELEKIIEKCVDKASELVKEEEDRWIFDKSISGELIKITYPTNSNYSSEEFIHQLKCIDHKLAKKVIYISLKRCKLTFDNLILSQNLISILNKFPRLLILDITNNDLSLNYNHQPCVRNINFDHHVDNSFLEIERENEFFNRPKELKELRKLALSQIDMMVKYHEYICKILSDNKFTLDFNIDYSLPDRRESRIEKIHSFLKKNSDSEQKYVSDIFSKSRDNDELSILIKLNSYEGFCSCVNKGQNINQSHLQLAIKESRDRFIKIILDKGVILTAEHLNLANKIGDKNVLDVLNDYFYNAITKLSQINLHS